MLRFLKEIASLCHLLPTQGHEVSKKVEVLPPNYKDHVLCYLKYNSNSTRLFCPLPVALAFEVIGLVLP